MNKIFQWILNLWMNIICSIIQKICKQMMEQHLQNIPQKQPLQQSWTRRCLTTQGTVVVRLSVSRPRKLLSVSRPRKLLSVSGPRILLSVSRLRMLLPVCGLITTNFGHSLGSKVCIIGTRRHITQLTQHVVCLHARSTTAIYIVLYSVWFWPLCMCMQTT